MGKIFELAPEGIERLLHKALIGRIACAAEGEGRPYLVPIGFGYDGEAAYFLSGPGRKIDIMRKQPLAAFEVDEGEAEDRWRSVVADGTYEELASVEQRRNAMKVLFGEGPYPEVGDHMIFFRLVLTRKSGRYEVPDDEAEQIGAS